MPTQQKTDRVNELKDKLERCTIAVTTDYTGVSVNEMVELRRRMRAVGAEFTVVKNTLMNLAAEAAQHPQLKAIVQGPTSIVFGYDEPSDVAKAITEYVRTTRSVLAVRGAFLSGGPVLSQAEVGRLAALPAKPQMIAQLLGQLQAPMQRLLGALNGPLQNLDGLLQARIQQLESNG